MKDLLEAFGFVVWLAALLGLVFLFHGEPDLWDVLHERAMTALSAKQ